MARKKVNLQLITNTLSRRATYKRRCQGLMKKASELAALCGAKACVVVYGESKAQPEVWPSYQEARRLLIKYRDMPEHQRFKKVENQKDFLGSRVTKLRGMVNKSESENNKRESFDILHERMNGGRPGLFGTSTEELTRLQKIVSERKSQAKERLLELGAGKGQGAPLEPRVQLLPGSSSQPQDPNTQQPQPQHPPNGAVLGTLPSSAFPGSSGGCASPSSTGGDMMQPYSPGCYSEFPWTWEWSTFPPME
ncbi:hypothetical protein SETIT_5G033100v2 [Setaria italica]|uniref:MADS-box domain-containing protein n=1 Tax=Setaria italica TaxID=4555 RepID=K3XSM5_SETIT|nr:agamous-like MADS-box protein AGL80 [Setaria italica]RCV23791.1 hypothetical protein SETIT_5G033100v2 [Setaria italica]